MANRILVTYRDGSTYDIADPAFDHRKLDPALFDPSPPDPLAVLVPYLPREPGTVILAGLGDVDEIGPALKRWPTAKFIGVEPDPRAIRWQREHSWPERFPLLRYALSDVPGRAIIRMDSICCPSLHPENVAAAPPGELVPVTLTTLDIIDDGRLKDVVLWVDCEGWDFQVLVGGTNLLKSGRVLAVNFEVWYRLPYINNMLYVFLDSLGYQRKETWFRQWWGHNEVWGPK